MGGDPRTPSNGVPTIGILVDWLESAYQWSLLRGALDAARDGGARLLCFAGGALGDPSRGSPQRNRIFELIGPESVDALVIISGALGMEVGAARLRELCARYEPLPMCSLAIEMDGMSCLCADNDAGMRQVVTHLLADHGMRRVAFVRGPVRHVEAERRFSAYCDALAEHGIALDPDLVVQGDFHHEAGCNAVRVLFGERKLHIERVDAIVAANDQMALGVLEELDRSGIRVPEQIALAGFDDIDEARFATPPLTTARQPLVEQGSEAVQLLLAQLRGSPRVDKVVLHTELVTRRSCGCFGEGSGDVEAPSLQVRRLGIEAALMARRELISADLMRAARGAFSAAGPRWEQRLLTALADQLRESSSSAFVEALDDLLRRLVKSGVDLFLCQDVIGALRRQVLACCNDDPGLRAQAEDMFHRARILTGTAMERAQAWKLLRVEARAQCLGRAVAALAVTSSLDELRRVLGEHLRPLGIRSAYVAAFERGPNDTRLCRPIVECTLDAPAARLPAAASPYRAEEIFPRSRLPSGRDHAFFVAPLFFDEEPYGMVLLELSAPDGFVYEALRGAISASLKGIALGKLAGAKKGGEA